MPNMTEKPETYQGWANYPTWAVNLWLSNDEGLYLDTRAMVAESRRKGDPAGRLALNLQEFVDELLPDLGASFASDLLGYAVGEVDWYEIAENWLSEE